MPQTQYLNPMYDMAGAYSAWHRRDSMARFLDREAAAKMSTIDLDEVVCGKIFCEYEGKTPLMMIESALDIGQATKPSTVLEQLCRLACLPGYVVLYKLSDERKNPANPDWQDIECFRVRRIYPHPEPYGQWRTMGPAEYAGGLNRMRQWIVARLPRIMALRATLEQPLADILGIGKRNPSRVTASTSPASLNRPPAAPVTAADIRW